VRMRASVREGGRVAGEDGNRVIGSKQGDCEESGAVETLQKEIAVGPNTAYCLADLSWIS
jgi:hypothetical protein